MEWLLPEIKGMAMDKIFVKKSLWILLEFKVRDSGCQRK